MPDPTCTDPAHDHGPDGTHPSILCGRPPRSVGNTGCGQRPDGGWTCRPWECTRPDDCFLPPGDDDPMTDNQLRQWLTGRGVRPRDVQLYVGQNRGKTRAQMDAEYDRLHGNIA